MSSSPPLTPGRRSGSIVGLREAGSQDHWGEQQRNGRDCAAGHLSDRRAFGEPCSGTCDRTLCQRGLPVRSYYPIASSTVGAVVLTMLGPSLRAARKGNVPKRPFDVERRALTLILTRSCSMRRLAGGLGYGMKESFTFAPAGYTLETVLVATSQAHPSKGDSQPERVSMPAGGPNAALAEYGDYVLTRHNKTRAGPNHTNEVAHIGYSTTGGFAVSLSSCLESG